VRADAASMRVVDPIVDKRGHGVADRFAEVPTPVGRVYVLAKRLARSIEPLGLQEAFGTLMQHTQSSVATIVELTGAEPEHLRRCTQLAQCVPVFRLARPASLALVPELARWVEAELTGGG
jgi:hypothetical protein